MITLTCPFDPSNRLKSSNSYKILNPKGVENEEDGKTAAGTLITSVALDEASYRLGHTKAWSKLSVVLVVVVAVAVLDFFMVEL